MTQYIISLATNVLSTINLINIYSDDINQVVFAFFCNYVRYVIAYGHFLIKSELHPPFALQSLHIIIMIYSQVKPAYEITPTVRMSVIIFK